MNKVYTQALLSSVLVTGAGEKFDPFGETRSFQLTGTTSAGAGTASVDIEVSNDGTNFLKMANLSLVLGTSVTQAACYSLVPWRYVRGNVIAITGTDASVTLTMGNQA